MPTDLNQLVIPFRHTCGDATAGRLVSEALTAAGYSFTPWQTKAGQYGIDFRATWDGASDIMACMETVVCNAWRCDCDLHHGLIDMQSEPPCQCAHCTTPAA